MASSYNLFICNYFMHGVFCLKSQDMLTAILQSKMDWMHACGKKGRCTTCKGIVISGSENLSPMTEKELQWKTKGYLAENERLMCQTFLMQNRVVVEVPKIYQLPHITYSATCL